MNEMFAYVQFLYNEYPSLLHKEIMELVYEEKANQYSYTISNKIWEYGRLFHLYSDPLNVIAKEIRLLGLHCLLKYKKHQFTIKWSKVPFKWYEKIFWKRELKFHESKNCL